MNTKTYSFESEEFGELRATIINGIPWFVGTDAARGLGYKAASETVRRRVNPKDMLLGGRRESVRIACSDGYICRPTMVNETGLFSIILKAPAPIAERYKQWVTSEVLPAIYKAGKMKPPGSKAEDVRGLCSKMREHLDNASKSMRKILRSFDECYRMLDETEKTLDKMAQGKSSEEQSDNRSAVEIIMDWSNAMRSLFADA